jgi:hypothetical protein
MPSLKVLRRRLAARCTLCESARRPRPVPAPRIPKAYQWPPLARGGGADWGTGFFGPPCASWGVAMAFPGCGPVGVSLSIIFEPNQQIEPAKSAFGTTAAVSRGAATRLTRDIEWCKTAEA